MTEIEVPIDQVQEDLHHNAVHGHGDSTTNRGALLCAILAVAAAISALFAGHFANEAMILQMQSSDQWAYYQAKGIKASLAEMKGQILKDESSFEKVAEYKKEQEEIKSEAEEKQKESRDKLHLHESLAASVTLFQIAIALTAISVLSKKRAFLNLSLVVAVIGLLQMLRTFLFH